MYAEKTTPVRLALLWALVQHWGGRVISFGVFFILARLLTPDDFGLVALAIIVMTFTEIFIDQGFGDAIVQRKEVDDTYLSTAFWVNVGTGIGFTLLAFLVSDSVARLLKEPRIAPLIEYLSITFVLTGLAAVPTALLRRQLNYKSLALRTTAANLISGIVSTVMAFSGYGVMSLVVQQIVFTAVSTLILWLSCDFRPSLKFDRDSVGDLFGFGIKVCGNRVVEFFHTKLIDALIGTRLGSTMLGIYSVGTRLGLILLQLLGASLADVYLSHFSRLQHQREELAAAYLGAVKKISLVCVPLFAFLAIEAGDLVPFLFGRQWVPAAGVFAAFSAQGIIQSILFFNSSLINGVGRPGIQLGIGVVKLVLFVIAFALTVSQGVSAIAWGLTFVTIVLIAPVSFTVVLQLAGLRWADLFKQLAVPFGATALASLAAYGVALPLADQHVLLRIGAATAAFAVLYGGIVLALERELRAKVLAKLLRRDRG